MSASIKATLRSIEAMLELEKDLILSGQYEKLSEAITARNSALDIASSTAAFRFDGCASILERIRAAGARNGTLLMAARQGVHRAKHRRAEIEALAEGMNVYTRDGRVELHTVPTLAWEKRA